MSAMKHLETASIAQKYSKSESLRSRFGLDSAVLSGTDIKVKTNKKLMTINDKLECFTNGSRQQIIKPFFLSGKGERLGQGREGF